jgi:zinc transporter 1/2/3
MIDQVLYEIFMKRDDEQVCSPDNDYDGRMGLRISSIFAIMVGGGLGVFIPLLSSKYSVIRLPPIWFFIAKFFGSGVIIATGFIHLLSPANEALSDECLGGVLLTYPFAFAIALITLFLLFFSEVCAYRFIDDKIEQMGEGGHSHSHFGDESMYLKKDAHEDKILDEESAIDEPTESTKPKSYPSHFDHALEHQDPEALGTPVEDVDKEAYYSQLLGVFVLEFGVLFHSVFVGLSLAVSGDEFISLYIVLIFHQMFEGFGLGSRIALVNWGKDKRFTPWILCIAFTLITPVAIAIGLGVRTSYLPGSRTALITNGVFDSISAGILIYTGLVELMAHEFLFSGEFKGKEGFKKMLLAYFIMCWGAGLMSLLGRWA